MANLTGLAGFVSKLKSVRTNLVNELRHVDAALSVLGKLGGGSSHTRPKRVISAASRRKMVLAQRARWAGVRKQSQSVLAGKTPSSAPAKRTISAAGKRRIAAAQRARWAKLKAGKKK